MNMKYKQDIKQEAIKFAYDEDVLYFVSNVCSLKHNGIYAKPKKFSFSKNNIEISYVKLIVENYDLAKSMNLQGWEQNDCLIGGVSVLTKEFGNIMFGGQDAKEIINAFETPRIYELQILSKQITR